ncbi:MAG: hypothetical protein PHS49_07310 [Candidatus Gracilibacteria bacterium]|nr:hypothetical protein [Candidatus Gracilibacteria bacterium]
MLEKERENLGEVQLNSDIADDITSDVTDDVGNVLDNINDYKFDKLVDLATQLGLTETEEMLELREQIIDLLVEGVSVKHLKIQYEDLAIGIIDKHHGEQYYKAQIALNILYAAMYLISGKMDIYSEEVEDIITYASNMGYDEILQEIQKLK